MLRSDRCLPERPAGECHQQKDERQADDLQAFRDTLFSVSVLHFFSVHTAGSAGFRPGVVKIIITGRLTFILFLFFVLRARFQVSGFRICYCANLS
jgi:hypothetical protein